MTRMLTTYGLNQLITDRNENSVSQEIQTLSSAASVALAYGNVNLEVRKNIDKSDEIYQFSKIGKVEL